MVKEIKFGSNIETRQDIILKKVYLRNGKGEPTPTNVKLESFAFYMIMLEKNEEEGFLIAWDEGDEPPKGGIVYYFEREK